jgi:hypothetical protein
MNKWQYKDLITKLPNNKGHQWAEEGNCYGKDTKAFVYRSKLPTRSQRHKLEKICNGCPVMLTCRYEAIRNDEEGWWGGMDPIERRHWATEELLARELFGE